MNTNTPEVLPTEVTPAAPEKKYDIPMVENASQAKRLAKFLFGAMARVHTYIPNGIPEHDVSVEQGDKVFSHLGTGATTYRDALQSALDFVRETLKTSNKLPNGVSKPAPVIDSVAVARDAFIQALATMENNEKSVAAAKKLHPHEVLAIDKLSRKVAKVQELPMEEREAAQKSASDDILYYLELASARPDPTPTRSSHRNRAHP
jgi:hypothetical protein